MSSSPRRHRPSRAYRLPVLIVAVCGVLAVPFAGQAAVVARLDRSDVVRGGTFTLDIDADGTPSGAQPDLSPLQKDFIVLGSASQSEISFVNGRRSDHMHWSVQLQARGAGPLVIPSITVGSEHTAALSLTVASPSPREAAETARHVFVDAGFASGTHSIYVQQQVPYVVRLYFDDSIRRGELAAPAMTDAVVEQLGADQHGTATRDGQTYHFIERTYAISPEKSGPLHVPPVVFNGSRAAPPDETAQRATDPAEEMMARMLRDSPFGNDPLLRGAVTRMPFANPEEPVSVQGKEVVLDVKPRPAAVTGDWLPAEAIMLHDSWQDHPPQLKAGEPATRTITIEAKGLSASQIPTLSIADAANARLYPESPANQSRTDGKTIFGISTQKVTYIPNAEGTLDVPPVVLRWWDVDSDTARQATLPAMAFGVAPGAVSATPSAPQPAPQATDQAPPVNAATTSIGALTDHRAWLAGGGLLAIVLVALVLLLDGRRRRLRRDAPAKAAIVPSPPSAVSLRALRQACSTNDAHGAARALLDLARAQWPVDPPRGLTALALRLAEGAAAVRGLEHSLYGAGDASAWRGDSLLEVARRGLRPLRSDAPAHDDGLHALYPSRARAAD